VLNESAFVSADLKSRVESAVAALGYQPNLLARSMAKQRTQTIGMIVPDIANPFFPEVVRGAEKANTGEDCSQTFLRYCRVAELPRNLDGLDRTELRSRQSRIEGRKHHAAASTPFDHHSRHRRPHARDALRVGKDQCNCGSRHHGQDKAMRVPARQCFANQEVTRDARKAAPVRVTRRVNK
jgi:hypothetical protein